MLIVAALGGNALLARGEPPAADIQRHHVVDAVEHLAVLAGQHQLIVTHGNGPQVGLLALESAADPLLATPYPFDALGAQTQGLIGYWLLQALENALPSRRVLAMVTQTEVDLADPAFGAPTKFVGPLCDEPAAQHLRASRGWRFALDGASWRRVVPSPRPRSIVELDSVREAVAGGAVVVCAGGGGVPVARDGAGRLAGVEAVVDKDLASSLLATELDADALLILTDVAGVQEGFGTPGARTLGDVTLEQLRALRLPEGSMGPKVTAACEFVEATGNLAAIGRLDDAPGLLAGTAGTRVRPARAGGTGDG
jgi:carbamate kinase